MYARCAFSGVTGSSAGSPREPLLYCFGGQVVKVLSNGLVRETGSIRNNKKNDGLRGWLCRSAEGTTVLLCSNKKESWKDMARQRLIGCQIEAI